MAINALPHKLNELLPRKQNLPRKAVGGGGILRAWSSTLRLMKDVKILDLLTHEKAPKLKNETFI